MTVIGYKFDEKGDVESAVEIEYNVENEHERMDAAMKLMPFMPLMPIGGKPSACSCKEREGDTGDGGSFTKDMASALLDMLEAVWNERLVGG